jgi:hypothetical protein
MSKNAGADAGNQVKLSSGKKLEWADGRPVYSEAQLALCCALIELQPHPLDKDKKYLMSETVEALDLVPAEALIALGELIDEMRLERKLKYRPRRQAIQQLALKVIDGQDRMRSELQGIFGRDCCTGR